MNEAFLHYIWQHQYFDKSSLMTTAGELITVLIPGFRNTNAGPDFLNAKIKIESVVWIGHVEIHINSSEWIDHKHHTDAAYDNVILHVVWKENQHILLRDHSRLLTLELKNRISEDLLIRYRKLINLPDTIPCAPHLSSIDDLTKFSMVDRAVVERLQTKSDAIQKTLIKYDNDWDQTAYHVLSKNFGFKVNSIAFERLAEILPYRILLKHSQTEQVEALLFGQAGLLDDQKHDPYYALLLREYNILARKYSLADRRMNKSQWKFLRLRPANFPTIRLSQFAALVVNQKNLFSKIVDATSYGDLLGMFSLRQSDYWQTHYTFDHPAPEIPPMGESSIFNLVINSAVPLMVAYGKLRDDQRLIDQALEILNQVPPEDNAVIKRWKNEKVVASSAAESQGLLEMNNNYCTKRRCLDCNIGYTILMSKK